MISRFSVLLAVALASGVEAADFEQRWAPVRDQPLGRVIPPAEDETSQEAPLGLRGAFQGQLAEYPRPPRSAAVRRGRKAKAGAGICARHGLRQVWTQDKRRWRCRK